MREQVRDNERLQHILDAIDALEQGSQRYTAQQAAEDCIIYFGFVKQVEIIGEAIEGMRHVLVHGYYQITPDKVWTVISKDLPVLRPQIEKLLKSFTI